MNEFTPQEYEQIMQKDAEVMENLRAFYDQNTLYVISEIANLVNVSIMAVKTDSPLKVMIAGNLAHLVPVVATALKLDQKRMVADISTLASVRRFEK